MKQGVWLSVERVCTGRVMNVQGDEPQDREALLQYQLPVKPPCLIFAD